MYRTVSTRDEVAGAERWSERGNPHNTNPAGPLDRTLSEKHGNGALLSRPDGSSFLSRMSDTTRLKTALEDAGVLIYRALDDELQVAERVRLHIMDSGVRVRVSDEVPEVVFTVRAQRSKFPDASPEELLMRVRAAVADMVSSREYTEIVASSRDVTHDQTLLDVWHEVTYAKRTDLDLLVDEVKWALGVEKYVTDDD